MPALVTLLSLLATYLCIPPNCGVPKYNLDQNLTRAEPLDPKRLYLSVYPPPEDVFRVEEKPDPSGLVVRPGSTSMWGAVRFLNGYSPIRPAGVAREFGSAIHGEFPPWATEWLLGWEAAPAGLLARLGVDGIIVSGEVKLAPSPAEEWELASSSLEGSVYHRRGAPLPQIQSLVSDQRRPNERFAIASTTLIDNSRHRIEADVIVPAGDRPALLTFSRPYFRGYEAQIGQLKLPVQFHLSMMPAVEVPPGTSGRLVLRYRPWWLIYGGAVAILSAATYLSCALFAARRPTQ